MAAHWDVEVEGKEYVVTIERGESGKDVVRVNGRVAAKPIGADEERREVSIAGMPYVLTRNGDSYDLTLDEEAAALAHARTLETANVVLAHGDAPVQMQRDSFFEHLPKLGYIVLIALIGGMVWYMARDRYDSDAKERVRIILREMAPGTGATEQFAITFWAKNRKTLDTQEMSWAVDNFTRWRREKELNHKFADYAVTDVKVLKEETVPTAIVSFTVDGKPYKVRVPKDQPIRWEE